MTIYHKLDQFLPWLKTLDPELEYSFSDIENCMLMQYFKSQDLKNVSCGGTIYTFYDKEHHPTETYDIPKCIRIPLQAFTVGKLITLLEESEIPLDYNVQPPIDHAQHPF